MEKEDLFPSDFECSPQTQISTSKEQISFDEITPMVSEEIPPETFHELKQNILEAPDSVCIIADTVGTEGNKHSEDIAASDNELRCALQRVEKDLKDVPSAEYILEYDDPALSDLLDDLATPKPRNVNMKGYDTAIKTPTPFTMTVAESTGRSVGTKTVENTGNTEGDIDSDDGVKVLKLRNEVNLYSRNKSRLSESERKALNTIPASFGVISGKDNGGSFGTLEPTKPGLQEPRRHYQRRRCISDTSYEVSKTFLLSFEPEVEKSDDDDAFHLMDLQTPVDSGCEDSSSVASPVPVDIDSFSDHLVQLFESVPEDVDVVKGEGKETGEVFREEVLSALEPEEGRQQYNKALKQELRLKIKLRQECPPPLEKTSGISTPSPVCEDESDPVYQRKLRNKWHAKRSRERQKMEIVNLKKKTSMHLAEKDYLMKYMKEMKEKLNKMESWLNDHKLNRAASCHSESKSTGCEIVLQEQKMDMRPGAPYLVQADTTVIGQNSASGVVNTNGGKFRRRRKQRYATAPEPSTFSSQHHHHSHEVNDGMERCCQKAASCLYEGSRIFRPATKRNKMSPVSVSPLDVESEHRHKYIDSISDCSNSDNFLSPNILSPWEMPPIYPTAQFRRLSMESPTYLSPHPTTFETPSEYFF